MGKNKRRRKEGSKQEHVAGSTVVATTEEGIVYHLEDASANITSDAQSLPEWSIDYVQSINTTVSALVSTTSNIVPSFNDISECMLKGTLDRLQSKKNKSKKRKDNNESASAVKGVTPTSIQLRMWPAMLQSFQSQNSNKEDTSTHTHNIYGIAPTGTGKTLSYALPIVTHCVWRQLCQKRGNNGHPHKGVFVHGLVLAPTRELAIQISKEFKVVAKTANKILSKCCEEMHQLSVQALAIYGGVDIESQISSFSLDQSEYDSERSIVSKSLIVASTPGRLQDLLKKDNNTTVISAFENLQSIVFDEADRIAMNPEMTSQVDDILGLLNKCRKKKNIVSCLVSATLPEKAKEICDRWVPRSRLVVKIDSVKITKDDLSAKHATDAASDRDEDTSFKMEATKTHKRHIDIDLASIPSHLVQTCKLVANADLTFNILSFIRN